MSVIVTGKEFNNEYTNNIFCTILSKNKVKNIDEYIYIFDISKAGSFLWLGDKFSYVDIPDNAEVHINKDVFKTNKIILRKIEYITYAMYEDAIRKEPSSLLHVPKNILDFDLCWTSVSNYGWTLGYVPNELINFDIWFLAIQTHWTAIKYVPLQYKTYKLCMEVAKYDVKTIKYFPQDFRMDDVCIFTVQKHLAYSGYTSYDIRTKCFDTLKKIGYDEDEINIIYSVFTKKNKEKIDNITVSIEENMKRYLRECGLRK